MNVTMPRVTRSIEHYVYAYSQAPWRVQRQRIGVALLIALLLAAVAALYLEVTSQAAVIGRQIQDMSAETITADRSKADLQSQIATLQATGTLSPRAQELGFAPVDSTTLLYVIVPSYSPARTRLTLGAAPLQPNTPSRPPEYTESLVTWLVRYFGGNQ